MDTAIAAVIAALITGVCSVVGNYFTNKSFRKKSEQEKAVKEAQKEAELKAELLAINHEQVIIQQKLDEHNGYAKRFEDIAVAIGKIETKLEMLLKEAA